MTFRRPARVLTTATRRLLCVLAALTVHAGMSAASSGPPASPGAQSVEMLSDAQASINVRQLLPDSYSRGWIPYTVSIRNDADHERTWSMRMFFGFRDDDPTNEWVFTVPAGSARDFAVQSPYHWLNDRDHTYTYLMFDGPGVGDPLVGSMGYNSYGYSSWYGFVGMSQTLSAENWGRLEAAVQNRDPSIAAYAGSTYPLDGTVFDLGELHPDWRSFSTFESMFLHRRDWNDASTAHRNAILQWIAQGGRLHIVGSHEKNDVPIFEGLGNKDWDRGWYGFGMVNRVPFEESGSRTPSSPETVERLPIETVVQQLKDDGVNPISLAGLPSNPPISALETAVGFVTTGGVTAGIMIMVIALLLGPLNVLVFARGRRRARLFVTVPVIALSGSIALVILILAKDGTGGTGRRAALLLLLPNRPEMLVLQEQTARTGLLLNNEFELAGDVSLIDNTPPLSAPLRSVMNRPFRGSLFRRENIASGKWFTSHSLNSQHLRQFVPTRAAITVEFQPDWIPVVISTCPTALENFVFFDGRKNAWKAPLISPGQRVALEPAFAQDAKDWAGSVARNATMLSGIETITLGSPFSFYGTAKSWDENVPIPTLRTIDWEEDVIFVTGTARRAPR